MTPSATGQAEQDQGASGSTPPDGRSPTSTPSASATLTEAQASQAALPAGQATSTPTIGSIASTVMPDTAAAQLGGGGLVLDINERVRVETDAGEGVRPWRVGALALGGLLCGLGGYGIWRSRRQAF
jgi:hypothetical protein